jgi:hypothetical protein
MSKTQIAIASDVKDVSITTPAAGQALVYSGSVWQNSAVAQTVVSYPAMGRLTLTTGTPVTRFDITDGTTIYYTPYVGNRLALYNGSSWDILTFSELSKSLSGLTASSNYDVFCYSNSGTPTLETLVWSNAFSRATDLAYQDGVLVKSGAATRRYLGSIRISGATGTVYDTAGTRGVWNMYNREARTLQHVESTVSWTYQSVTPRYWKDVSASSVGVLTGLYEKVDLTLVGGCTTAAGIYGAVAVGLNGNTISSNCIYSNFGDVAARGILNATYSEYLFGYNVLFLLEVASASAPTTFYGNDSRGGIGVVWG